MTAGTPGLPAPRGADFDWTPRQRQVLDLLVARRTNAEIAAELGVSLDGAKWHLREILGKLGVDTREEAADYWRGRNRLPVRLWRAWAGLAASLRGRPWPAIAGVLALAVATAAVVFAFRSLGGEPTPAAIVTPSPATTGTPTPTVTPTPAQATPAPSIPLTSHNGVPVYELVYDPRPAELPRVPDTWSVLLFTETCAVCTGAELYRLRYNGEWLREPLPVAHDGLPPGYPLAFVVGENGRVAATWCLQGERSCGKHHDGSPVQAPQSLLLSDDGGVSWRTIAILPERSNLIRFDGEEVLAQAGDPNAQDYRRYPSGASVPAPNDQGLRSIDRLEVDTIEGLTNASMEVAMGPLDANGTLDAYFVVPGASTYPYILIDTRFILATAERNEKHVLTATSSDLPAIPRGAYLFDLAERTVRPILGLEPLVEWDHVRPIEYRLTGQQLVVQAGGDCLNVREAPGMRSPVLTCLADRALTIVAGGQETADGITWQHIRLPDGRTGWAAAEFLAP